MSTTLAWLQNEDAARLAFMLVVDGVDLSFTTHDTPADLFASGAGWNGTDWTSANCKAGLQIVGSIGQSITLFDPTVELDSLTFNIVDDGDKLISTLFREADSSVNRTYLTADLVPSATSCSVKSTTGFATSGTIYIGHEAIGTGAVTSNSFTWAAADRGQYSLFGTSSSSTRFARAHLLSEGTASERMSPVVTSAPRVWYNRLVALYAHHYEAGTWVTRANARLIWTGRIKSYRDNGDGVISINTISARELLKGSVFANQYVAEMAEGIYLATEDADIQVEVMDPTTSANCYTTNIATLSGAGSMCTWSDALAAIQKQFNTWGTAASTSSGQHWAVAAVPGASNTTNVQIDITLDSAPNIGTEFWLSLSPRVFTLLGFGTQDRPQGGVAWRSSNNSWLTGMIVGAYTNDTFRRSRADLAPLTYLQDVQYKSVINLKKTQGTWVTQTSGLYGVGSAANGSLKIGDTIYDGTYASGTPDTFTILGIWAASSGREYHGSYEIREGNEQSKFPPVKQVWHETTRAGKALLQLALSTGSANYNDSTYDKYAKGMGLGIPWGMFATAGINSFTALNDIVYNLYLDGPTPYQDILERICAFTNRYPIAKNGLLRLVQPVSTTAGASTALTESNKGDPKDRTIVERATDGLINRMQLTWAHRPGAPKHVVNVEDLVSTSDFGQQRTAQFEMIGIYKPDPWVRNTAAYALAYFSRPVATASRSINYSLIDLAPGDPVALTDSYAVDAAAGTRGVTNLPCWVLGHNFDWSTGIGDVKLAFLPETDTTKRALWAPSALISSYAAGTKVVTCASHAYSASDASADVSWFDASDGVRMRELSAVTASNPTTYNSTVASVSTAAHTITLSTDPTAGSGLPAGKTFVLEFRTISASTTQTSQKSGNCFIADDANNSTGDGTYKRYEYDADPGLATNSATVDYSTQHVKPDDEQDDTGAPMSVRTGWHIGTNLNALYAYKTARILVNDGFLPSAISVSGTTSTLAYGPIELPIYGHHERRLRVNLYGYVTTGGAGGQKFYGVVKTATAPVRGTATTSLTYPGSGTNSVTISATSSSYTWQTGSFVLPTAMPGTPARTWLTVEVYSDAGGTAVFRGITVAEEELT